MKVQVTKEIAGRTLSLTTGEIGKQASGVVLVQYGETVVMVAAQVGGGREGLDFFPLTVDYRERYSASGRFPGGFIKREGRPSNHEILTMRLTDRPLRPLFPKGYRDEVQIQSVVLSCDLENLPDVWSINGASAALHVSPAPFRGPIGACRVGLLDGKLIAFPTHEQLQTSDLDLVVAGSKDSVLMIEGFGSQIPDDEMVKAISFAHGFIRELCALQEELARKVNVQKPALPAAPENPFLSIVKSEAFGQIQKAKQAGTKHERADAVRAVRESLIAKHFPNGAVENSAGQKLEQLKDAFYNVERDAVRDLILKGTRLDGRKAGDLRRVDCQVALLPRVHG